MFTVCVGLVFRDKYVYIIIIITNFHLKRVTLFILNKYMLPNSPLSLIRKISLRVTFTMCNMLAFNTAKLINVIYFIIQLKKVGFELLFISNDFQYLLIQKVKN